MSKFIKCIGNCCVNNYGFDLYENKDGSATIRPVKLTSDLPSKHWVKFDSLNDALEMMENLELSGAQLVQHLKEIYL